MATSILERRVALLAKKETTYGVEATPDPTLDAIEIADFNITPNMDSVTVDTFRDTLSAQGEIPTKKYTELTFKVYIKGNGQQQDGATAPRILRLLEACGMQTTATPESTAGAGDGYFTLTPVSNNFDSLTFYVYMDKVLYKVVGARGNVQVQTEANQLGALNFTFQGLFVKPVDATMPSVTYEAPNLQPPVCKNAGLTLGGTFAPILSNFEFDFNNELVQRDDLNAPEGVGNIEITGRKVQGSVDPDMFLATEYDLWQKFLDQTPETISATIGANAGNKLEINLPNAVYSGVSFGARDSIRTYSINFTAIGSDDEVSLIFK